MYFLEHRARASRVTFIAQPTSSNCMGKKPMSEKSQVKEEPVAGHVIDPAHSPGMKNRQFRCLQSQALLFFAKQSGVEVTRFPGNQVLPQHGFHLPEI